MAEIDNATVFATGPAGTSGIDSLTMSNDSVWAEYGNRADSTGKSGSSTIVQYAQDGTALNSFSIQGSVDGLKANPVTGQIWALVNQDGNSVLRLIDAATGNVGAPLNYDVTSDAHGYDDVAFSGGHVYLSYTNPAGTGDPVLQELVNGNTPLGTLVVKNLLLAGATGTNIATGKVEALPLSDPDSLKSAPGDRLILSSGDDNSFTIVSDPGTKAQSERFVNLTNLPTGSGLDDVIIPTSSSGTFYISNTGTNQIEAYKVSGLNTSDAYASVGTEIVQVDLQTGAQTVLISGLKAGHGVIFQPDATTDPVVQSTSIFAVGGEAGGATKPDSVTLGDGSVFVEYGNGADATGMRPDQGSSTIVQYGALGEIEHTYTLPGSIDGLKIDPTTGKLFALQHQDGNSFLYVIDPATQTVSDPLSYAAPYVYGDTSTRGFDDVAFSGGKVYLSYTNPANTGDSVIAQLDSGHSPAGPLTLTSIVRLGDTGTNLTTGELNQPLPVADPDSLKTLADGSLVLTSDRDTSLTIIAHPGTDHQTASFIKLPAGVSGLDDAVMPTSTSGTFIIANTGANDVLKVAVTGLNLHDIYISVGSENAIDQLDPTTGKLTPFIVGLNSPHGFEFIPAAGQGDGSSFADLVGTRQFGQFATAPNNGAAGGAAYDPLAGLGNATAVQIDNHLASLFVTTTHA